MAVSASAQRKGALAPASPAPRAAEGTRPPALAPPRALEPPSPDELGLALAQALAREAELRERLRETSDALLEANRQLAQLPLIKHRQAEFAAEIEGSRSWRLTAPLRRLWLMLGRQP